MITKTGIFKITGSIKITNRSLVIAGNIVDGRVKDGYYITFNAGTESLTMKIASVEFIDNIPTG